MNPNRILIRRTAWRNGLPISCVRVIMVLVVSGCTLAQGLTPDSSQELTDLIHRARQCNSSDLIVWKDGRRIADLCFERHRKKLELKSVTKSIASLAIGSLLHAGEIQSLDAPICTLFPEWKQGQKRKLTLRHVMSHTSGIQCAKTTVHLRNAPDTVQLALCAELANPPGTAFFYNNKAVNLLGGVVRKCTKKSIEQYLRTALFHPLGIRDFEWAKDSAGNPRCDAGLRMNASDLLKIGVMLLNQGQVGGKPMMSADWLQEATSAAQGFDPSCGLLWWVLPEDRQHFIDQSLIKEWREAKLAKEFIDRLIPLQGKKLSPPIFRARVEQKLGTINARLWIASLQRRDIPSARIAFGPKAGFFAQGEHGQFLAVIPARGLVAVRLISDQRWRSDSDSFPEFLDMLLQL